MDTIEKSQIEDYSAYERLLDGRKLHIRAVRSSDKNEILDIWDHLSSQSIYYRFLSPKKSLTDKELEYFTNVDFKTHVALLGFVYESGRENPVGAGRYISIDKINQSIAEVAFMVEDEYHGLGIATHLLNHLAKLGRERGIEEFVACVLDENKMMLEVFEHSGLEMEKSLKDFSVWDVKMKLS